MHVAVTNATSSTAQCMPDVHVVFIDYDGTQIDTTVDVATPQTPTTRATSSSSATCPTSTASARRRMCRAVRGR